MHIHAGFQIGNISIHESVHAHDDMSSLIGDAFTLAVGAGDASL